MSVPEGWPEFRRDPRPWGHHIAELYSDAREWSARAMRRADSVYIWQRDRQLHDETFAAAEQVIDMMVRLSGILAADAARLMEM